MSIEDRFKKNTRQGIHPGILASRILTLIKESAYVTMLNPVPRNRGTGFVLNLLFEGQKMDIIDILGTIKGKVLDTSHFDLLINAYELQNQNIVQLKDNNDALRVSSELLKQKIKELNDENTILRETIKKYKNIIKLLPQTSLIDNFSEIAVNILELYISNDTTELWEKYIMRTLSFSEIQVQEGLDELRRAELISSYSFDPSHGREYSLTEKGRYNLAIKSKQSFLDMDFPTD